MPVELLQIDAFADGPFRGNPAAVCLLDAPAPEPWMQAVAGEMNLSETAFVAPGEEGFSLRWFTPAQEVDLCGHATLASAHALWEVGRLAPDAPARFVTRSGALSCARRGARIEMDFPAEPADAPADSARLAAALGAPVRAAAANRMYWLAELADEDAVRGLAPDLAALRALPPMGVVATARGTAEADFVSRFFAPRAGVDEDPVTGSAHCALGPWWAARLGRAELVGRQLSARGGEVRVRVAGARVQLGGSAVTVLRGALVGAAGEPA